MLSRPSATRSRKGSEPNERWSRGVATRFPRRATRTTGYWMAFSRVRKACIVPKCRVELGVGLAIFGQDARRTRRYIECSIMAAPTQRIEQRYVHGVGASGALLAGALIAFISVVGLVSLALWPSS